MGTSKSRILIGLASTLGMFRSIPVFGSKPLECIGDSLDLEQPKKILREGMKPQNIKLNKAEAKRYRKRKTALRNQARCAGMVC